MQYTITNRNFSMSSSMKVVLTCCFLGIFLSSCHYNNEEELYPVNECPTTDMSFAADVLPVFDSNCNGCHSTANGFGGIVLDNYQSVKATVDNGRLFGAINHDAGFSPMPQGNPKLSDCTISKIEAWINDGAQNN